MRISVIIVGIQCVGEIMLEISEIKSLMGSRASVFNILGGMFSEAPKYKDVYALCKSVWEVTDIVEIIDENDELLSGYNDLQEWYNKVSEIAPNIIDVKLAEEFADIFLKKGSELSVDFPTSQSLVEVYHTNGYFMNEGFSPSHLSQMLYFISYMAENGAVATGLDEIQQSAKIQLDFIENYIMPLLSEFCSVLYERAEAYGIYVHIAVIIHGYMNLDCAAMKYF